MTIHYYILISALLGLAGWLDISRRRIPNAIVAAIALLWLPHAAVHEPWLMAASLATALVLLGCGIMVWRQGWLGGGDVKLITALGLWAGPFQTPALLLATALSGGVLALLYAAMRHRVVTPFRAMLQLHCQRLLPPARSGGSPEPSGAGSAAATISIPYGVAVAAGGCWLLQRLIVP